VASGSPNSTWFEQWRDLPGASDPVLSSWQDSEVVRRFAGQTPPVGATSPELAGRGFFFFVVTVIIQARIGLLDSLTTSKSTVTFCASIFRFRTTSASESWAFKERNGSRLRMIAAIFIVASFQINPTFRWNRRRSHGNPAALSGERIQLSIEPVGTFSLV
jgi:hypothetical protein